MLATVNCLIVGETLKASVGGVYKEKQNNLDLGVLLSNNADDQKFISPLVKSYTKGQSLRLVESSFESIESVIGDKLMGYDIFTNLPFGKMANQNYLTAPVISKINDKFDRLLYRVKDYVGEVFVVYPMQPSGKNPHYIGESQFEWHPVLTFDNSGFEMGLFKCTKRLKGEVMVVDRSHQKTPAVPQSDLAEEFQKVQLNEQGISSKKSYMKQEAVKQQRRNEYLKDLKEKWEEKKAELERRKEQRRINKSNRVKSQLEKAGIQQEEIDLLQRKIDKRVREKEESIAERSKPKSIPRW